ncbi:MAG: efflux RND transporter permease subunit [Deltaproteobacteria bacterium]|nr:efflux RND transporter permease subunit [Candidatus Anaeroferrophillus wilburensis]MBN2888404.1 efflux RND transporter permease subunit [Deltaproteobacteria bacterium]
MTANNPLYKGPIAWMAENHVAANLLMIFLLVGGFFWGTQIKQEVFPEFTLDTVVVSVVYPGASPEEVAEGIVLPVEEAIQELDGIEEITSTANEGVGTVTVEAHIDADLQQLAVDIKNEVDRITAFPEEAEEPLVTIPSRKRQVVTLVVYGDQSPQVLREVTEMIRDQLVQDEEITQAELLGESPLEMSIEVSQESLRAYNLKLEQIAQKVKNASLDLPGGSIKTRGGEILVRMKERRDLAAEFARIPIISGLGGTVVTLGEIAEINDGFEETDQFLVYNGKPALGIDVFRIGKQTPITVSGAVHRQVERLREALPTGILVDTVNDRSDIFKQRIQLLIKNGCFGLVLVFILLGVFLELRLAFWVTMGIPISFLGSLLVIPQFDVSINMVSLFAFIISLGIVVDDAIVVGENVYSYKQEGCSSFEAAVRGAKEIAVPVTFSVLTNIVTFLPLYFVPGVMGKIFRNIPVVVASVFFISLVESLIILPAHLGHQKKVKNSVMIFISRQQQKFSHGFATFVRSIYGPFLKISLRFRYVSITLGIVILMVTIAYVKSGRMGMTLFPRVESDLAYVQAVLPVGVPVADTMVVHDQLLAAGEKLIAEIGREKQVKGILSYIDNNSTWIQIHMIPPEERLVNTSEFTRRWRQAVGSIAGLETIKFRADHGGPGSGAALTIELQHRDTAVLEQASAELAAALSFFPLVSDIDDGFTPGKEQLDFKLKPAGYRLGLDPREVARQVRSAYYGYEVLTQLRGRNELTIMVRNPDQERKAEYYLDEMLVSTPKGVKVPLQEVVEIIRGNAYTTINRRNGRRVVTVSADVTPQSKAEMVSEALKKETLPQLKEKYHGLDYSFAGKQSDRMESMAALGKGMIIAMLVVYLLLAVPFKSYIQPAIIMVSIPFGIVGAIVGHLIMGYSLSLLSMFGIVALSGVVVNDALVLIDFANRKVRDGSTHYAAIVNAGIQRFRPIILTTLTTFFGLMPMIFETSMQARFLIPMAISLGFGILFSTLITLIMVPALYVIVEDVKNGMRKLLG